MGLLSTHTFRLPHVIPYRGSKFDHRVYSSGKSVKKLKRASQKSKTNKNISEEIINVAAAETSLGDTNLLSMDNSTSQNSVRFASREDVLKACTVTSGLIAALGVILRQASHIALAGGLPISDCSVEVSFGFEAWHLELILGLVIFLSSCRYLLLKSWPDFAESSEAANQQVLTSLEPLDYLVVAFLPGISEELLFRGALLPLFGFNWTSVFLVGTIFGVLHLGSGRKYSFAIWATFVGILYGYATVSSSSILVPMATHSLNNLVGGLLWRYQSKSPKTDL